MEEFLWFNHFYTATNSFKPKYDKSISYEPNSSKTWKKGETGFPLVDAGMKELNNTGFMHNRVRFAASFLCKHLLLTVNGEKYFALKLNDYEICNVIIGSGQGPS